MDTGPDPKKPELILKPGTDPDKPGPKKTLSLKNLDADITGSWKTRNKYGIKETLETLETYILQKPWFVV